MLQVESNIKRTYNLSGMLSTHLNLDFESQYLTSVITIIQKSNIFCIYFRYTNIYALICVFI